jgi:hypothetical protein
MRRMVKAITYKPKIEAVFDGRCTQTIRKGDKVRVGDIITFHEWAGKPYRSKWGRRITVEVIAIQNMVLDCCWLHFGCGPLYFGTAGWGTQDADRIAKLDFIDPPTGIELRELLSGRSPNSPHKNQKDWEGVYQIIRWKKVE